MDREEEIEKSHSAFYLLFAEGCCFILIAAAVLACGFALNFHDDFDYDKVTIEYDYTQYWVGFVLLITAFLAIGAGTRQRNRFLVLSAMFFFLCTILVSLFALVTEGNDWVQHKHATRRKAFWESEDYECTSPTTMSCVCSKANSGPKEISGDFDCKTLERVDFLYGGLICCILAGVFLALSSIVVALVFIPIRPFTIPVPKKRIRKITILEDKEPKPIVVYKPARKKLVEPEPEVEEIVIREKIPQRKRMIVAPRPEPRPRVEEIVVREPRPRVRTIVYDEPRPRKQVFYSAPRRQGTLVYDKPRPEGGVRPIVPNAAPWDTEPREQQYDVGRFVPNVHPTPNQPRPAVEEGFIVNPNYRKPTTIEQTEKPETVHYGRKELKPVRYVRERPQPVRVVPLRREEPVRYLRRPTAVYEKGPWVYEERALVPARSTARPKPEIIVRSGRPQPSYIPNRQRQHPPIAVQRRPRAYSDEGPRLYRPRESRHQWSQRVYTTQPAQPVPKREHGSRMVWQRVRSNSDQGPRLYRERLQRERPGRVYTDKEIAMVGGDVQSGAAKPRLFTRETTDRANLGKPQAVNEPYDRGLEASLQAADKWNQRPPTPY